MIYETTISPVQPKARTRDHEEYFTKRFTCPKCGEYLGSYSFGRAWTDNGMPKDKRIDCPTCRQPIDWSRVPLPEKEEKT